MHTTSAAGSPSNTWSLPARLLLMLGFLAALIAGSSGTRKLPPGERLTIWVNTLFFVALGVGDELVLAPVLDRWPLLRAAMLAAETLSLGWFFSPGANKPASKVLFFVHIGPFFAAVLGGAAGALTLRRLRSRSS